MDTIDHGTPAESKPRPRRLARILVLTAGIAGFGLAGLSGALADHGADDWPGASGGSGMAWPSGGSGTVWTPGSGSGTVWAPSGGSGAVWSPSGGSGDDGWDDHGGNSGSGGGGWDDDWFDD